MKTYNTLSINDFLNPTLKKLNKKFCNKLSFIRSSWIDIAPDWALDAYPYSIKNNILFFKSSKNALILQFREKELLKITNLILGDCISKIKILAK